MSTIAVHICLCKPQCVNHAGFCPTCTFCGHYIDAIVEKHAPFLDDPKSRKLVKEFEARRRAGVTV